MNMNFRDLNADEIDVRVAQISDKGVSLLLYKDARVDQRLLDDTVGQMNWQRDHKELKGNIYCGISIWDDEKKTWITKWDAGKESNTESEKGEASDSFKRAGFNWGIGRELYTAPFIWINNSNCKIEKGDKGKLICKDKFKVKNIAIVDKTITALVIENITLNKIVFSVGMTTNKKNVEKNPKEKITDKEAANLYKALELKLDGKDNANKYLLAKFNTENTSDLTREQYDLVIKEMKNEN